MADKWTQLTDHVDLIKQLTDSVLKAQKFTLIQHFDNCESMLLAHKPEILQQHDGETKFAELQQQLGNMRATIQAGYSAVGTK